MTPREARRCAPMTPREALFVLESLRDIHRALARPLAVPGLKSELTRALAQTRAEALTLALEALNDRRRRVEKRAEKKLSAKELSL